MNLAFLSSVVALLAAMSVAAADANTTSAKGADFETLKKLAGDWQVVDATGKVNGTARYQLTSAGTAVVETMFVGEPHEMVTVFTRDGEDLAVTHYCAGGNQPHLKSKPVTVPNRLEFDFKSAANLKSPQDSHMHSLVVTFVDGDHVKQEWVAYADGKPDHTMTLDLTRT